MRQHVFSQKYGHLSDSGLTSDITRSISREGRAGGFIHVCSCMQMGGTGDVRIWVTLSLLVTSSTVLVPFVVMTGAPLLASCSIRSHANSGALMRHHSAPRDPGPGEETPIPAHGDGVLVVGEEPRFGVQGRPGAARGGRPEAFWWGDGGGSEHWLTPRQRQVREMSKAGGSQTETVKFHGK